MVQEVAHDDVGSGHKARGSERLRDQEQSIAQSHQVEWSVRMTSPGCPKYENTSVRGGAVSVKCI